MKELDKPCFAYDGAYSFSKNLVKRTVSDKILEDRTYEISVNHKYDEYQRGLASMVFTFLRKTQDRKRV